MALDPFIEAMLARMAGRPALSAGTPAEGRALVAAGREALGRGPEMADIRAITVPSRGGGIPARYLRPKADPDGLVLYLHGGGWAFGTLDDYDTYGRALAAETGYGVLLLDYRLAPEHPFPAGLEDTEDALTACINGIVDGIPRHHPLVVAGDSAGANLATVALLRSSRRDRVALQVLSYPVTDCDFATASYATHGKGLPLTADDMRWFFAQYAPESEWTSPDISPLRARGLAGMPPAVIVTAEYDVLCDEGEAYAQRLREAGVPVTLRRRDSVTHGFVRLHNLFDLSRDELKAVAVDIKAAGTRPALRD